MHGKCCCFFGQVSFSKITDSALSWLSDLPTLEHVELLNNDSVTARGLAHLLTRCPRLKTVGKSDKIGEALSLLYDVNSLYKKSRR